MYHFFVSDGLFPGTMGIFFVGDGLFPGNNGLLFSQGRVVPSINKHFTKNRLFFKKIILNIEIFFIFVGNNKSKDLNRQRRIIRLV
jgi:hypothetical protein